MPTHRSCLRDCAIIGIWVLFLAAPSAQPVFAQNKVIATYTFPDVSIKEFHNKLFPQSVANDRKVRLGSIGTDLWHGPKDPRDEFWMLTDRGPNGQIRVDGSTGELSGFRNSIPLFFESRHRAKRFRFWKPYRSLVNRGSP